jgi:hypothetical protein
MMGVVDISFLNFVDEQDDTKNRTGQLSSILGGLYLPSKKALFIIGIKILVTTVLCLGFLEKAKHLSLEYSSYDLLFMFPKIRQKLAGWTDRWLG